MPVNTDGLNLGQLGELAVSIREQKRDIDRQSKELSAQLDEVKAAILTQLGEIGVDRTAVNGITLSRSETTVPQVTDWDAVNNYIRETGLVDLLQRRVSSLLWRDLIADGDPVPGIEPFVKTDVNIRRVS